MAVPLPRPHRHDVLIAAVGLIGGLLLWTLGLYNQPEGILGGAWTLVPLVVMSGTELLRRTRPQYALPVATLALVADLFTVSNLATIVMFTDIVYAAVVYGTPAAARRLPVVAGLLTVAVTIAFLSWIRDPQALLIGVVTGLITFAPASTGAVLRNHREAAEAARLRAEQKALQAEQTALLAEMDRTQAVTAERSRMARELHDMVANHLSAIAIHSTAALSLDDERTTRNALTVIRENSVEGLAEMRRLIGLLRDSSGDPEPAVFPTLDGLSALVEHARTNGLDATLTDVREPGPKLPAPVELAAYRIVQESLTNALKHAAPGPVAVRLSDTGDALTIEVTSPYGDRAGPRAPGSGAGLVGMRERAALLDGTFGAGPQDTPRGKVWQVLAVLPLDDQGAS